MISKKVSVSVVLPAYNEEGNVPALIERTIKAFNDNQYSGEIVFVNDGSKDDTLNEIIKQQQKYKELIVVNHKMNLGLTEALMSGFEKASGDIIVFLCADLQSAPEEDVPKLVNKIIEGYDVVFGLRNNRPEGKIIVSKIYNFLVRMLFGISLHDMNWIKAFRKEVVKKIKLRSDWHRYIAVFAVSSGYSVTEVETNYYPRVFGKSKYGKKRILSGFLDLLTVKFEISYTKKPMLLFGSIGLLFILAGILLGVGMFVGSIITGFNPPPSKGFYFLLILFIVVGVQSFSFGFLAEFMVTILDKINKES